MTNTRRTPTTTASKFAKPPRLLSKSKARALYGLMGMDAIRNRHSRIDTVGYVPYTSEEIKLLVRQMKGKRVLELGAGTGYLSKVLRDRGIKINACDSARGECTNPTWWSRPRYLPMRRMDHRFLQPYKADVVLLVWPCLNTSFAADVVKAMLPGQMLYYRGESEGGCTASVEFFKLLKTHMREHDSPADALNASSVRDYGIHDYWSVYTRVVV